MGQSVSDQMYLYMGERYLGKNVKPNSSYAPFYGWMGSMMSRYSGSYAGMMGYRAGAQGTSSSGGWPAAAILAVAVLGALLLVAGLVFALPRLRGRGHGDRHTTPAAS
jgi:hypothetical protein